MCKKFIFKLMKIIQRFCKHIMNISNLCKLIAMLSMVGIRKAALHGLQKCYYMVWIFKFILIYLPFTQKTYSFYFMLDYNLLFSIGYFA